MPHGGRDNPPAPYQTSPKVGAQGQPLAMGSVPVPRPLRALRAGLAPGSSPKGWRGGIHRQLDYEVPAQPSRRTRSGLRPPALVRRAQVLADFPQESGFAGPSQDVPARRRCRQALVPAGVVDQTRHKSQSDLCLVSWTNRSGPPRLEIGLSTTQNYRGGPLPSRIHLMRLRIRSSAKFDISC